MTLFGIECTVTCVLFTIAIQTAKHGREEQFLSDYPKLVTQRLIEKGHFRQCPPKEAAFPRKLGALALLVILFALLFRFVNGITDFSTATAAAYALWLVVDWYDFLVLDLLFAFADPLYQAAEVHPLDPRAASFHLGGSLRGTILGLLFAPLVGGAVLLL